MNYDDVTTYIAGHFSLIPAIFFGVIFLFAGSKHKIISFALFLSSLLILFLKPIPPGLYNSDKDLYFEMFTNNLGSLITINGGAGLVLTMFLNKGKRFVIQSFVSLFFIITYFMVYYALNIGQNPLSVFFYTWYSEMIIGIYLIQMAVSLDGFIGALGRIQSFLHWLGFHYDNGREAFFAYLQGKQST